MSDKRWAGISEEVDLSNTAGWDSIFLIKVSSTEGEYIAPAGGGEWSRCPASAKRSERIMPD